MNIKKIVVGVYAVNCYIVYNEENKGFIVDPGGSSEDIIKFLEDEKIIPEFIVLTHGHGDHIGAINDLKEIYNIPIYASEKEVELLADNVMNLSSSIPPYKPFEFKADKLLKDEEILNFYGTDLKIIETPGHTVGSICIIMENVIFSGDTLFKSSVGRSDLPTGNPMDISASMKKLKNLDGDFRVLCGHGAETTLQVERDYNPFMR